ncbi:bifunctional DNA primase/polymerase [Rhodopseudomonas palustris]|uniref:bifunctional DNA primase/polymerase n=1 Tax=Rhodopseudomonas palustris TaxID=1076 RepID=UPI001F3B77B0|nr:bifunctional DNA primase/polymerase [Rhodopseudomonas palustris]
MESPFAQVGPALYSLGYSPIPIMPGGKRPGIMIGDDWMMFKGWNEFCVSRPTQFQINLWSKWPNAGVGVACGQGLICIDIDREELIDPIIAILPPSRVQKKGRKGVSLFFRGNTEKIRSRNYRTADRIGLLDLLAEGKQTVLPPSIHPDTGEPYYWSTDDTLEDTPIGELTELPDDIAEQIGEVLKPFGYDPDRERAQAPDVEFADTAHIHTSDFFRRLNEDALANIPAWAPKLALPKGRFMGRVYRAVAPWRSSGSGRSVGKRSPNLSISPGGIEDFGTGERFTALNVVMKALEIPEAELDAAVQWLGENLGYDFGVEIDLWSNRRERPAVVETKVEQVVRESTPAAAPVVKVASDAAANRIETEAPAPPEDTVALALPAAPALPATTAPEPAGEPEDAPEGDDEADAPAPTLADLEALCHAPGLVGDLIDWIAGSSSSPSRPLALGAALTFLGTLAGRVHAGPTNLRTNLYVVALANSGYGKEHARGRINALAMEAGLDRFIGPEGFLSDSALRKTVEHNPAVLCLMDEFGGFINKIMDRRAGTHQSGMRQMIMQMFTTSASRYAGMAAAAETATPIWNPCLSLYGTTTPHDFWPAMSGKGVADGFLPRWLVLTVPGDPPVDVPLTAPFDPPHRLVEDCRAVVTLSRKGNLPAMSNQPVKPLLAEWGPGAEDGWRYYRDLFKARGRAMAQQELAVLWTRSMEIALRIAHIVAIGVNPEAPVVTAELVDWAARLTELSTRSCIIEVRDRLASTEKQAEYLKVRRLIKDAGREGLSPIALKRAINGEFDLIRLDNITKQLQEAKQIEFRQYTGAKGGRPGFRWFVT